MSGTNKESVCEEADRLVIGTRQQEYGSPADNLTQVAELWSAYLGLLNPLRPEDVACLMALLKIARTRTGKFGRDSLVDIVGYIRLIEIIQDDDS